MSTVVLFFLALGLMIVESVALYSFSIQGWALQTPLVVAIYLGLDRDFVPGALMLMALLFPIEWLVGGVFGVYSLGLVVVFLAMRALRPNLQTVWGISRGIVALAAVVLHSGVMVLALFFLGEAGGRLLSVVGWQMWVSALTVAGATVIVGRTFARIDAMMDPHRGTVEFDP